MILAESNKNSSLLPKATKSHCSRSLLRIAFLWRGGFPNYLSADYNVNPTVGQFVLGAK